MEYLTKEKKEELENEVKHLVSVRRQEIATQLEYAKSLGDLSENAEYHQAREDQAACEERISHIENVLKNAVIMNTHEKGVGAMGASVTISKKGEKEERVFTLVGSEEADSQKGHISNESPLGAALLGKKVGDIIVVETPKGNTTYVIKKIV